MDFWQVVKTRRSIRVYKPMAIAPELVEKIVDAGRFAPTARNVQPWEFIVVRQRNVLLMLSERIENARFLSQAGVCVAVFCKETKYYLEDGSAAIVNMLLAARDLGIGSCWVAGDKKDYASQIKSILKVPDGYKLVGLVSLGYPLAEDDFSVAQRRPLRDLLHWEYFGNHTP